MSIITQKDVAHVAKLARIATNEQELAFYQEQLEKILGYITKLQQANTDGVPATAHPYKAETMWRKDEAVPFQQLDQLFKNAPEMEETFYRVKKVIE